MPLSCTEFDFENRSVVLCCRMWSLQPRLAPVAKKQSAVGIEARDVLLSLKAFVDRG